MANERLPMRKIKEILRLKHVCGLSGRQIAKSCRVARSAVGDYLGRAERARLSWPQAAEMTETEVEATLFPEAHLSSGDMRPAPDCQYLYDQLRSYRKVKETLTQLWLEYREQHPHGYQYTQFCEHYRRWRDKLDYCMHQEHRAGEKVFLDYCDGLSIVDPGTVPTCRDYTVLYARAPRLFESLQQARGDGSHLKTLTKLGKAQLLIIDDFLLTPLAEAERRDLLEIVEERHGVGATVITSQCPIKEWHPNIPIHRDSICDRLLHSA